MQIKKLKSKNGVSLFQYPSGTYGIEHTNAAFGYGMKYTDNKSEALKYFNKVSSNDKYNLKHKNQNNKKKNFRIIKWK